MKQRADPPTCKCPCLPKGRDSTCNQLLSLRPSRPIGVLGPIYFPHSSYVIHYMRFTPEGKRKRPGQYDFNVLIIYLRLNKSHIFLYRFTCFEILLHKGVLYGYLQKALLLR